MKPSDGQTLKTSRFNIYPNKNGKLYIANTLTGATVEEDSDSINHLRNGEIEELDAEHVHNLFNLGILVEENLDEIALLRGAYFNKKFNKDSAHYTICTTLECNFRCPYCYEKRQAGPMSSEVQREVVRHIEQTITQGIKKIIITWYGGEPLLYPEVIDQLSAAVESLCSSHSVDFEASIITNGFLLTKSTIAMLESHNVLLAQITIDGDQKTHDSRRFLSNGEGTFSEIVSNVCDMAELSNIIPVIRVNLDRTNKEAFWEVDRLFSKYENVYRYPAIVTLADTQGDLQSNRCFSVNERDQTLKDILDKGLPHFGSDSFEAGISICTAEHLFSWAVDPEGFIYRCLNDVGRPEHAVSSVLNPLLQNPSNQAGYIGRDPFNEPGCFDCSYIPLCLGGCYWEYLHNNVHLCPYDKYYFDKLALP